MYVFVRAGPESNSNLKTFCSVFRETKRSLYSWTQNLQLCRKDLL